MARAPRIRRERERYLHHTSHGCHMPCGVLAVASDLRYRYVKKKDLASKYIIYPLAIYP
jgi:hypothetical protein